MLLPGLLEDLVEHQPSDKGWQSKEAECVVGMLLVSGRKGRVETHRHWIVVDKRKER